MIRLARLYLALAISLTLVGLGQWHATHFANDSYDFTSPVRVGSLIGFGVLLMLSSYAVGLPDLPRGPREAAVAALVANGLTALLASVIQLTLGTTLLPRFVIFGSAMILVPVFMLANRLVTGGRARAESVDRVLLVGTQEEGEVLRRELVRAPERPASLRAVVCPDAVTEGSDVLRREVVSSGATLLVLDRQAQANPAVVSQAADLHEEGLRVRTLSLFYNEWLAKLPVGELERISLMFDVGDLHRARYGRVKRLMDVVLGLGLGALYLLSLPFVLLGNLLANRGPLLFRQPRVGRYGTTFDIVKFRTMRGEGRAAGEWTTTDDPRVTPFGRVLRLTHLDELPQAINILRGELSLVGPRPEQPHYVEHLEALLPHYGIRHLVRPGLTGWAQVKYPYGASEEDAVEKLQYDLYYLRHQSLLLDLQIVARTIRSVVGLGGR